MCLWVILAWGFVDGGVDLPFAMLMAFTQLGRGVAVLDVSALARATEHVLPWAYARFLQARVHSARRPNRYGDRANAGQLGALGHY